MQKDFHYYLKRDQIELTDQGVLFQDTLILPIHIKMVDIFQDYQGENDFPHITCKYGFEKSIINTGSLFFFTYDPENPQNSLKELKKFGIQPKNKVIALSALELILKRACSLSDKILNGPEIVIRKFNTASRSGWFFIDNQWLYLTSEFAITSSGIHKGWYCTSPNAYLYIDHSLTAEDTYCQMLDLLNLDFESASPILSITLLSMLRPFRREANLYPAPGMLILGPTSSGKTELATNLAHILTQQNGRLNQIFILQKSARDLKQAADTLSDTPLILDDIRNSPASSLRQNIAAVMDSIVRSCFLEDSAYYLLPILTGECDALNKQLPSWRNRMIEVSLDASPDSMNQRRELIGQLHRHPLLVRTFVRYFLQFILNIWRDYGTAHDILHMDPAELEEELSDFICRPEQNQRSYDNLLMSLWSFKLFIQYGVTLDVLQPEEGEEYMQDYKLALVTIYNNQEMNDPQRQIRCLLLTLAKKMRIQSAKITEQKYFLSKCSPCKENAGETYGHFSLIDLDYQCSGVFIEDCLKLAYYSNTRVSKTLLVLSCNEFERLFREFMDYHSGLKTEFAYHSFASFKKALRKEKLLLGQDRYDDSDNYHLNYRINGYPCCSQRELKGKMAVYVFQLEGSLAAEVKRNCIDIPQLTFDNCHVTLQEIKSCSRLLESLI